MSKENKHKISLVERIEKTSGNISKKQGIVLLRSVFFLVSSSILISSLKANTNALAENTHHLIYLIVAALLISNLSAAFVPKYVFKKQKFIQALVILDILLLSLGLWLSQSVQSDFYLLYFITIMVCAISGSFLSVIIASCLVPVIYAVLAYLEFGTDLAQKTEILLRIPFLFISSIFYGYLVLLVRRESSKKSLFEKKYNNLAQINEYIKSIGTKSSKNDILNCLLKSKVAKKSLEESSIVSRMNKKIISSTESSQTSNINKEFFEKLEDKIITLSGNKNEFNEHKNFVLNVGKKKFRLFPFEAKLQSELYLAMPLKKTTKNRNEEESLPHIQTALLHTSLALKNANQFQALLRESNKRSELSKKLSIALESQSNFIRNMSHELRTPISGQIGFAEIMLSDKQASLSDEQSSMLLKILQSSEKLQGLIDKIIIYSRLGSGEFQLQNESQNSEKFFQNIYKKHNKVIDNKVLKLSLEFLNEIPALVLDWSLLEDILDTFISNAIKYTLEGEVSIFAEYNNAQESLLIEIKDSGLGIEKERVDDIFKPFNNIDSTYNQKQSASNLNLAIVKRKIEIMEGEIVVKSKIAQGSSFILKLPAKQALGKNLKVLKLDSVQKNCDSSQLKA